jgi:predicted secreted hydrolase
MNRDFFNVMYENFVKPIEYMAGTVVDGVSELLGFGGDELRDPPSDGTVTLPADLYAQPDVQTEWWYYTGHCKSASGREFGFELVFFKRRTDRDKIGVVPMPALANPMYFAHFAISDVTLGKFRYEHIRSFDKPFDTPVSMSTTACDVRLGEWSLREVAGKHILHGTFADGFIFDAILDPAKPIVLNGDGGITKKKDGASKHFSYTRMHVTGQTSQDGEAETFTGTAWMDREYGSWEQGNWDWFSIQFDDETELMVYQFQDQTGAFNGESTGTFVDRDGTCTYLKPSDFEIDVVGTWVSPRNGAVYPAGWNLRVPSLDIEIAITPLIADQELDTRGSTMVVYWEGACSVSGTRGGNIIGGRAYVELVGYDMSHMQAGIGDFLFGGTMRKVQEMFG